MRLYFPFLLAISALIFLFPATGRAQSPINLSGLIPRDTGWVIDGAADVRYRNSSTGVHHEGYINAAELDLQHALTYKKMREGTFFLQVVGENPPDQIAGHHGDVQVGEAYVTYRLPIMTQTDSTAYLKVGQFILPFGLLPVYDTHLQILQTLYPESIGERIDEGIGVEGRFYGVLDYRFAITAGVGPNHLRLDPNRVVTFRLGRLFATPYGTFNFGGSLLDGQLPVTEVNPETGMAPELAPSGRILAPYGYVSKTRIAGDGQWTYRALSVRGEAIAGADNDTRVDGYYAEGDYRFAPGLAVVVARTYWNYGVADSNSGDNAIGLNVTYGSNLAVRTLYEDQRNVPEVAPLNETLATTHLRHLFTVQVLFRF